MQTETVRGSESATHFQISACGPNPEVDQGVGSCKVVQ